MGDSDNTTSLPFVTRRQVLAGGMIASTALMLEKSTFTGNAAATNVSLSDPALALWREWQTAHRLTSGFVADSSDWRRGLSRASAFLV
ncbi:hypothetical protein NKH60_14670 [Mesorhizobium sp. M1006]|uniref:hypothetical protein n=1 Tax=Mesorhizobium sp. M1006 TaxID=2957048 RepID=UPI00333B866B